MNEYERTLEEQLARTAKLERRIRELERERDFVKELHRVAVKERDLERLRCDRWKAEALAAREMHHPDGSLRGFDPFLAAEYAAARAANEGRE